MHLLSVILVIHHINSTNINEPLINHMAHEQLMSSAPVPFPSSLSSTLDTIMVANNSFDKSRPSTVSRNQSIASPPSANKPIADNTDNTMGHTQIPNSRSMSLSPSLTPLNGRPTVQAVAATKSMAPLNAGKVYNKNDLRKRKIKSTGIDQLTMDDWKCPNISENSRYLECGCDLPYTLRCSGDIHGLQQIAHGLRQSKYPVSLLDCTLKNVTFLSDARIFDNVSLHGLVISSGEIKRVHRHAFLGLKMPLQALGLPNNALTNVPAHSLTSLTALDRLDLSNNRIKYLGPSDFLVWAFLPFLFICCLVVVSIIDFVVFTFVFILFWQMLQNLTYLELSDNNISEISARSFLTLKRLQTLKLNGNRLESGSSLQAIGQCVNLR